MISPLHTEALVVEVVTESDLPDASGEITSTTEERVWGPCTVQQKSATEDLETGEDQTVTLWVSGPLAPWITPQSRIKRAGRSFHIQGEPNNFASGVLDHTELTLITWKGRK